jgi:hypothetical protein
MVFKCCARQNSVNEAGNEKKMIEKPLKNGKRRVEKCKNVFKKIMTFLFSRIGLCFMVVGYAAMGGFIFKSIEGNHELEKAKVKTQADQLVDTKIDNLVMEIWNMTRFQLVFHEKNYTLKLKKKLIEYQKNLTIVLRESNKLNSNNTFKWTYSGSVLYALTLTTTIGYGHLTCETDTGKITTIFYSLIGIPMMLLCLANIGSSMANLFRFIYSKICCGYCNYVKRRNLRLKAATLTGVVGAAGHGNAISYAAITTTNFVFNNANQSEQFSSKQPSDITDFNNENQVNSEMNNLFDNNSNMDKKSNGAGKLNKSPTPAPELLEIFDENNSDDYQKITIPISATLFVFSSYILFGGLLFKALEGWTLLEGIYFCFITLSTIGLGDYVPGNSINEGEGQAEYKLIGVSLYLLLGLSFITMGFNLMQEEITAKFRKLAVRLGIIDDPNYW